jgi:hypothetical protein
LASLISEGEANIKKTLAPSALRFLRRLPSVISEGGLTNQAMPFAALTCIGIFSAFPSKLEKAPKTPMPANAGIA